MGRTEARGARARRGPPAVWKRPMELQSHLPFIIDVLGQGQDIVWTGDRQRERGEGEGRKGREGGGRRGRGGGRERRRERDSLCVCVSVYAMM